jgi:hypothetical protein
LLRFLFSQACRSRCAPRFCDAGLAGHGHPVWHSLSGLFCNLCPTRRHTSRFGPAQHDRHQKTASPHLWLAGSRAFPVRLTHTSVSTCMDPPRRTGCSAGFPRYGCGGAGWTPP